MSAMIARFFNVPKSQSLIWWMLEAQAPVFNQLLAFFGFLILYGCAFYFQSNSWAAGLGSALVLIVSMWIHEGGHGLVFEYAKIKWRNLLLWPLGAIAAPLNKEEDARSDLLPWWTIGWLTMTGPMATVGLMVLGLWLQTSGNTLVVWVGQQLTYINGWLAVSNLLPLGKLDAGQLFKVIFASLDEKGDTQLTIRMFLAVAVILLVAIFVPWQVTLPGIAVNSLLKLPWLLPMLVVAAGAWHFQGKDDTKHSSSTQAMTFNQACVLAVVYLGLLFISLWIMAGPLFTLSS